MAVSTEFLKKVVERFYERLLKEPLVADVFNGVDLARVKRHQVLLLQEVLGGPPADLDLKEAHARYHITAEQFDIVATNLAATLDEFNVDPGTKEAIIVVFTNLRTDIVGR
jgi:hemoglobin